MKTSLFDYKLPKELIAQFPARKRDQSRLLVLDRTDTGKPVFLPFKNVTDYIQPGDALVVNTTKVFKARLIGHRATGGEIEIFLVRQAQVPLKQRRAAIKSSEKTQFPARTLKDACVWVGLLRPARRVKQGARILFGDDSVLLVKRLGGAAWLVEFSSKTVEKRLVAKYGHVPLPHYLRRDDQPSDIRRYQTVYADPNKIGAVAAPTAGFHFTQPILSQLKARGVKVIETCLHVGPGTFKPVTADSIADHTVDPEFAELTPDAASMLNQVRDNGGKVFAVGTTTVRTLESAKITDGKVVPFSGEVDLYIRPGFEFRVVDHLITNFHLPKSSLLVLVAAFTGRERIHILSLTP